jgi:hypothetical protein
MQDIDSRMNYKDLYERYINFANIAGDRGMALCPFHSEKEPSFNVSLSTGRYNCFSCKAKGNIYDFLQECPSIKMSKRDAYRTVREAAGLTVMDGGKKAPRGSGKKPVDGSPYLLEDYAAEKKLSVEFLKTLGVRSGKRNGVPRVLIPYMTETGETAATRIRGGSGAGDKFRWSAGAKLIPYGLWLLPQHRENEVKRLVLIEGESDSHTLWQHDIPSLGIPGAATFKKEWVPYLEGFNLYLFEEPDDAGKVFVEKVCTNLLSADWQGQVFRVRLQGHKDPSELHCQYPDKFLELWEKAIESAQELDLTESAVKPVEVREGLERRTPDGYRCDDNGIYILKEEGAVSICYTPLWIERKLKSLEDGTEKLELGWKDDGESKARIIPREWLAASQSIIQLSKWGIFVTSNNAKMLIDYIYEAENTNRDLIPTVRCTEKLGWVSTKAFLPTHPDKYEIAPLSGFIGILSGYTKSGIFEGWAEVARIVRDDARPAMRLYFAGAFAAPLLRMLGERTFLLHLWGESEAGKTAVGYAALSVWGDPEKLRRHFNSTRVAMERVAGFTNDLPLFVDEKQASTDPRVADSIAYMLVLSKGKGRGAKDGAMQEEIEWVNVVLTTGEERLTGDKSKQGVFTRVIDLECPSEGPEQTKEVKGIYEITKEHYGHAGEMFIGKLIEEDWKELRAKHDELVTSLEQEVKGAVSTHVGAFAALLLADYLSSMWVFGLSEKDAKTEMEALKTKVLEANPLATKESTRLAPRAMAEIRDWLTINQRKIMFIRELTDEDGERAENPSYEVLGYQDDYYYYIVPSALRDFLEKNNFSPSAVQEQLAKSGVIEAAYEEGKRNRARFSKPKKIKGELYRLTFMRKSMLFDNKKTEGAPGLWSAEEDIF